MHRKHPGVSFYCFTVGTVIIGNFKLNMNRHRNDLSVYIYFQHFNYFGLWHDIIVILADVSDDCRIPGWKLRIFKITKMNHTLSFDISCDDIYYTRKCSTNIACNVWTFRKKRTFTNIFGEDTMLGLSQQMPGT